MKRPTRRPRPSLTLSLDDLIDRLADAIADRLIERNLPSLIENRMALRVATIALMTDEDPE